jgi:hypothetical protein
MSTFQAEVVVGDKITITTNPENKGNTITLPPTPVAVYRDTNQQLETKAILELFESMKVLEQQLAIANARIRELESQIYEGSVK